MTKPPQKSVRPFADPVVLGSFGFSAVLRLVLLAAVPGSDWPYLRYLAPAAQFYRGRWFSPGTADQLPGAPLYFALFMPFTGEKAYSALAAAQYPLGLAAWAATVLLAWRAGGKLAGRTTAVLLSLQLVLAYESCFVLSETTAHFFLALSLLAAYRLREEPAAPPKNFAAAGALAAMAALTRGELLVVGPLLAAALALPAKGRRLSRVGIYAAAWAALVGGWVAHNRLVGGSGFNALGSSIMVDYALPIVRYDLPSQSSAKAILREEIVACGGDRDCSPRLRAVKRLQELEGRGNDFESLYRAESALGAIAREAILTRPFRYAALIRENFVRGLRPIAWVSEERLLTESPVNASSARGGWRAALWTALERGPQYFGWLPALLIVLAPLGLLRRRPRDPWLPGTLAVLFVALVGATAPADMSARLQASIYFPLCLLGGLSAAFLAPDPAPKRSTRR